MLEILHALGRDQACRVGANRDASENELPAESRRFSALSADELRQRLHAQVAQVNASDAQSLADAHRPVLREIVLW